MTASRPSRRTTRAASWRRSRSTGPQCACMCHVDSGVLLAEGGEICQQCIGSTQPLNKPACARTAHSHCTSLPVQGFPYSRLSPSSTACIILETCSLSSCCHNAASKEHFTTLELVPCWKVAFYQVLSKIENRPCKYSLSIAGQSSSEQERPRHQSAMVTAAGHCQQVCLIEDSRQTRNLCN